MEVQNTNNTTTIKTNALELVWREFWGGPFQGAFLHLISCYCGTLLFAAVCAKILEGGEVEVPISMNYYVAMGCSLEGPSCFVG